MKKKLELQAGVTEQSDPWMQNALNSKIQETFEQIALLSEEQQDSLATYLKKHLAEFLEEAEKGRRIAEDREDISC